MKQRRQMTGKIKKLRLTTNKKHQCWGKGQTLMEFKTVLIIVQKHQCPGKDEPPANFQHWWQKHTGETVNPVNRHQCETCHITCWEVEGCSVIKHIVDGTMVSHQLHAWKDAWLSKCQDLSTANLLVKNDQHFLRDTALSRVETLSFLFVCMIKGDLKHLSSTLLCQGGTK